MLSWQGEYDEALVHVEKAARLSPYDPILSWWRIPRANIAFGTGDYEGAVTWAKKAIEVMPKSPVAWRFLAAGLAHLGRLKEAKSAKDRLLQIMPHDNLRLVRHVLPSVNADRMERLIDGLRKAGVPE